MTAPVPNLSIADEQLAQQWAAVLQELARGHSVIVTHEGKAIAEVRPPADDLSLPFFPELAGKQLTEDAFAPATEEEWPEDCR